MDIKFLEEKNELRTRVIPSLLLKNSALVKTINFKNPKYIGDPINTVRIYNEQEVDELILLDISASLENRKPPFDIISQISSECFMPFSYGGGIHTLDDAKIIFSLGAEKILLNSSTFLNPSLIEQISSLYGTQSIIGSIDARKNWFGNYNVFTHSAKINRKIDPISHAKFLENVGVGEIFITSINHEGKECKAIPFK